MKIRGHHLVCTYCFYGSGKEKAEDFFGIKNGIPQLLQKLRQNPDMEITAVADLDEVCDICPLKKPNGCGRSPDAFGQNEKLRGWDRAILKALDLKEGAHINAKELETRIQERIPDISRFCTNCSSSSPSGWAEYRKAILKGLWSEKTA